MRLLTYALIAVVCLSGTARAQDDEDSGGFLVDLLQNNLSGENRYIKVTGLEGALSGAATIAEITVSDDAGVWLTVRNAVLDWNRLALVRGRFSVNTLSAAEIIVARKPNPTETAVDLPEAEAKPFQVPELPVAVEIGEVRIDRFELGEPVIGRAAALSLKGALSLADGTLASNLEITRLDRETDRLDLMAGFQNETSVISLDLTLTEDAGGLVSEILSIPDRPSVLLTAKGEGPVSDFTADVTLASDAVERLGGQVRLNSVQLPDVDDATPPSIGFQADLNGDITPLLAEDYRDFFGTDAQFELVGRSDPDGRIAIQKLDVLSNALILNGALDIAGDRTIERVLLQGRIAPPRGTDVVLPIGDPRTSIKSAVVTARLEAEKDNTWDLRLSVDGLERADISLARSEISASGTLDQADSMHLKGTLNAALRGIGLEDAGLSKAIGTQVRLDGNFELKDETALTLTGFLMRGLDYSATVDAQIDGLDSGFQVNGSAGVAASDLSRFSALAGRDLTGAVSATVTGEGSPLGGSFDFDLTATAQDPTIGMAQVDNLISGETTLSLQAQRDETGLEIRAFDLNGTALGASAKGSVRSGNASLSFEANLDDLARVIPEVTGPLTMKGDVRQSGKTTSGTVRVDGPSESFADLEGTLAENGAIDVTFDALLARIERFVPEFPGSVSAKGTAKRAGDIWQIATRAEGPAGISADVAGSVDQTSLESDITAKGQVQLGAVNRFIKPNSVRGTASFDLAVKGPPALESVSGTITTANTSVALPSVAQTISDLDATIGLSTGQASISTTASFRNGGQVRVTGPVSLAPPFQANIVTDIMQLVLTDNIAIESVANGRLSFSGPLAEGGSLAGEILFGETNINIASLAGSPGSAPIPPMTHSGENGAQQATRARAGLIETESKANGGGGPVIALNIRLAAQDKVFVRGRGLQAELGGAILVGGTSAQVAPSGQIDLIRGTMAILGRRLNLTKGILTLQGNLEPYMEFEATTSTSDGDATLEIAGPLTAPEVTVYSDPERPSEEALAMLVFGDQFSELSPLKIAQMAASLAQLSGGGGGLSEGVREGLGVDTLDIGTDDDGNAQFGAGKYIADGVYTDISINTLGNTEVNLNLDLTDDFTVKGSVDNTGETGIGIFFERDY
jgi:translocation and assembly module TamB